MKWLLAAAIAASAPAHAGWFMDFCDRYLIMEDPYQYEEWILQVLITEYRREAVKTYWRKEKSQTLRYMGNALRMHMAFTPMDDVLREEIGDLLEGYSYLEQTKEGG